MTRTLTAVAATAVLGLALSGCGGGGGAAESGSDPKPSASAISTTTAASSTPASPAASDAGAGATTAPTSVSRLDGCQTVTRDLLNADLGTTLDSDGTAQASSYGDPNAVDCFYSLDQTTVVVQASTRADQDTPAASFDIGALPGAQAVPGADRGYAYLLSSDESSSVGTVFVVKGQESLSIAIAVAGAVTLDQLVKVGTDTLAAM